MKGKKKRVKYPQNLPLKAEIEKSGFSISEMARKIECSREILSRTIHGHHLGTNIATRLREELNK